MTETNKLAPVWRALAAARLPDDRNERREALASALESDADMRVATVEMIDEQGALVREVEVAPPGTDERALAELDLQIHKARAKILELAARHLFPSDDQPCRST